MLMDTKLLTKSQDPLRCDTKSLKFWAESSPYS